jgi:hypothetical protein
MTVVRMKPVNVVHAYNAWNDWAQDMYVQIDKIRNFYYRFTDHSSSSFPGLRMSKQMAEAFADHLKNALVTDSLPVAPLTAKTIKLKKRNRVGIETTEMYEGIEVYRTDMGGGKHRTGWVVGVKASTSSYRDYPLSYRLSWLEFGTKRQEQRPVVAEAYRQFLHGDNVNHIVNTLLQRGLGMTLKK